MTVSAGYLTVMLDVRDIARSLDFYKLLGFEIIDVDRDGERIVWARMHCKSGAVMFLPADEEEGERRDRQRMYLYTPDLPALREQLIAAGVDVGRINYPPYMPSGELCVADLDGNAIFIGHWSDIEDEAWERRLQEKRAAGLIP
ncbi:MAG: VOC family protein [Thermoanaerobaculia bacterium]